MYDDIFCALSGIAAENHEILNGTPVNWLKVTVEKNVINPEWAAIQLVKKGLIESALAQMPDDQRSMQRMAMEIQVNASFHSYESDIEQFISLFEEVNVSPPEKNESISEMWSSVVEMFGLEEDFTGQMSDDKISLEQSGNSEE